MSNILFTELSNHIVQLKALKGGQKHEDIPTFDRNGKDLFHEHLEDLTQFDENIVNEKLPFEPATKVDPTFCANQIEEGRLILCIF